MATFFLVASAMSGLAALNPSLTASLRTSSASLEASFVFLAHSVFFSSLSLASDESLSSDFSVSESLVSSSFLAEAYNSRGQLVSRFAALSLADSRSLAFLSATALASISDFLASATAFLDSASAFLSATALASTSDFLASAAYFLASASAFGRMSSILVPAFTAALASAAAFLAALASALASATESVAEIALSMSFFEVALLFETGLPLIATTGCLVSIEMEP